MHLLLNLSKAKSTPVLCRCEMHTYLWVLLPPGAVIAPISLPLERAPWVAQLYGGKGTHRVTHISFVLCVWLECELVGPIGTTFCSMLLRSLP